MKKRIIAVIAAAALLVGVLAGCTGGASKQETTTQAALDQEVRLSGGTFVTVDANTESVNGYEITAKDGSWRMTVHECYSAEELKSYRESFDKNVEMNAANGIVTDKKQLGDYSWDVATYMANEQNFGEYFTALDSPAKLDGKTQLFGYSISSWMEHNTAETRGAVENVIASLRTVKNAEG